jgi:hypothetical protein
MRAISLSAIERLEGLKSSIIVRRHSVHFSEDLQELWSPNHLIYIFRTLKALVTALTSRVVMANSGCSLFDFTDYGLELLELPLYRFLRKRVIVTYQGCEIRQCESCPVRAFISSSIKCPNVAKGRTYQQYDKIKMRRHAKWQCYADHIFGITPDLCRVDGVGYFPHVKYLPPGLKTQSVSVRSAPCIRIAHAPKKLIKGTDWIEKVIGKLQQKYGDRVQYVPVSGLSWEKSLDLLSTCDILVDQVLFGWYGGICVEAAFMNVVPIAYIDRTVLQFVPVAMQEELPVVPLQDKEELYSTLESFIRNPEQIRLTADILRANVEKHHNPRTLVRHLINTYYLPPRESVNSSVKVVAE